MKQKIKQTLMAIVGLLLSTSTFAHDFEVDGIYYNIYDETNKKVHVTYKGSSYNEYYDEYIGVVTIPSSVTYSGTTYSVTSIGSYAFYECTGLTSVTIPNTVASIGYSAFDGCTGLTSITIPNSVTLIREYAFAYCEGLTSVTIPNSVTTIGYSAFDGCTGLTSITIPNSVTAIGDYAFAYCEGLTSVTIPNSVTTIGSEAFYGTGWYDNQVDGILYLDNWCLGYKGNKPTGSLSLIDDTRLIANSAFKDCTGLTSVTIPNSVTKIGDSAFRDCTGLTSVTIPNSVTKISDSAFKDCTGLTEVNYNAENCSSMGSSSYPVFSGCSNLKTLNIGNEVKYIPSSAFYKCTSLTSVTIGNSVTEIGSKAFYGCTSLTSVTIPNSVTKIRDSAFKDCTGLTEVNYNAENCTSMGSQVFSGCSNLKTLNIGNEVKNIPSSAFPGCTGLTSITIPNSVTSIDGYAFYGCTGLTEVNYNAENCSSMGSSSYPVFSGCSNLKTVNIRNSVKTIPNYAFYNCTSLASVTIGNSVTTISKYAFYGCNNLKLVINLSELTISKGSSNGYIAYYADRVINATNGVVDGDFVFSKENNANKLVAYLGNANELILPTDVNGENYEIGSSVFSGYSNLTSVTIPNSVISSGNDAFSGCSGLTEVNISNLSAWCKIDFGNSYSNPLYYAKKLKLNGSEIKDLVIPNDISQINNFSFYNCTGLTEVTIPNSVTSIGSSAFSGCTGLTKVYHNAENCTLMGSSSYPVFSGCTNLKTLNIGNEVKNIPSYAFYGCSGLTEVTIGNSVTEIGSKAFYGCSGLTSITIPNSVTSIGGNAFFNCSGLTAVNISDLSAWCKIDFGLNDANPLYFARKLKLNGKEIKDLVIPDDITKINNYAFYNCSGLTSVTIPNSVTSIGDYAFSGCSSLTEVNISDLSAWCKIDFGNSYSNPLYYAKKLILNGSEIKDLVIPNDITEIKDYTFYNCTGLTSLTIPNSVTSIGKEAFCCKNLKLVINFSNLTFSKGSSDYGYVAYYANEVINAPNGSIVGDFVFCKENNVNKLVAYLGNANELILPTDVNGESYEIGSKVFYGCSGLTSITIPNSVTSIGNYAFSDCTGLTSATIGNSVTTIGDYAFMGCTKLSSVSIPNSVTTIGSYAFSDCTGLTSATIGNSVTTISDYAFKGCTKLTSVTIPNSVTSIGESAFYGCTSLTSVTIPNSVTSIGDYAFSDCTGLTSATIGNSVTAISDYAFKGCTKLTSVTIPNSVTSIGKYAFSDCTGLTSATIGNSVTTIGDYAFKGCTKLTSVTIPNSVTLIGKYTFSDCTGLTSATIGNSVTTISDYAFKGCTKLTSVTIPNSVTKIGDNAFYGCTGLTEVNISDLYAWCKIEFGGYDSNPLYYAKKLKLNGSEIKDLVIPDNVTKINNYAFYNCSGLTSVSIPNSVTSIGKYAFYDCSGLTSITIGNFVTEIGEYAFYGCNNLKLVINLSKLTISKGSSNYGYIAYYANRVVTVPNGCSIYGDFVFSKENNVNKLETYIGNATELILPTDFNGENYEIGSDVFSGYSNLTSVTIPNSVTSIGNSAFKGCTSLNELIIENGTESLSMGYNYYYSSSTGQGLFYDCPLEKLYLGRKLDYNKGQSYGYSPFYNKSIKSVTIGSTILSIDEKLISTPIKTIWLTNTPPTGYKYAEGVVNYVSNDLYTELTDKTVYSYLSSMFEADGVIYVPVSPSDRTCDALDCTYESSIESVHIVKNVSYKDIVMNIKNVNHYTFYKNTYLYKVTIDDEFSGLLGDFAFAECCNIDGIEIPNKVKSIGSNCFEGCKKLESAIIGTSIPAINNNTFNRCSTLAAIEIPKNVESVGNFAFGGCKALKLVTIANRETVIELGSNGSNAMFVDCPLDSVYIGGNISYSTADTCGYSPFYRNTSLRAVTITDNETEISDNEFYGCANLKSVSIGDGVESIGKYAFSGCSSLESFAFGSSMKTIGEEAFSDCTAVAKIYSRATTPPTCGKQALDDINKWTCELYVPISTLSRYQTADQWKEFFYISEDAGVEDVEVDNSIIEVARYDINGYQLAEPTKGINIIKMSDGTIRKEFVK